MISLKSLIGFIVTFAFISCLGLFCALAGGIQWGTFNSGMASVMTAFAAVGFSALVAIRISDAD